ncbi:amidase [Nocardia terpenica]|uniref:amidase n=1 Tax=Nocardia terpenica TaxID=455432 RepID=A0A161XKP7_9NOCA|nr:amidase [Nocardia terpenica]KZM74458.1 amidase [Nocardia terpenica]NQE92931.1 amidase [Nocardia terpenica]
MTGNEIVSEGVVGQRAALASGRLSAMELVDATLDAIDRASALGAFTSVLRDSARRAAADCDRQRMSGEPVGPLHGIPVAVKDEIDVAGVTTTFGTRANSTPARTDAEVVRRLRAAGAVIVGKTAMNEFGQWPYTESSTFGVTRNPWDTSRSAGGSSGGSAAAVAAGLVPVALGGDGGGSIRIPAACCGLFGLKPQRGRVSAAPLESLWWALGTTGPLTRTVLDSALVYDVIRGAVPGDRFRAPEPEMSFVDAARKTPRPLRIGFSAKTTTPLLTAHPEQVRAMEATAVLLADLGHHVDEIDPHYPSSMPALLPQFFGAIRAEAAAVEHPELLERRTRQTLRLGLWARRPVVEWAIRAGESLAGTVNRVFARHDLLLTPTTAIRPPHLGVLDGKGSAAAILASLPMVTYTAIWNVTGNPAASIPVGIADDGLPLAVQLVGPPGGETAILPVAAQLEQARPQPRAEGRWS